MTPIGMTHALLFAVALSTLTASAQTATGARVLTAAPKFEEFAQAQQEAFLRLDEQARQWAKNIAGVELDGSVESLELLERVLVDIRDGYLKQGSSVNTGQLENICLAFGTYVGEVFRRELNGTWGKSVVDGGAPQAAVRAPGAKQVTVLPMRRVCDRIVEGPTKNVHEYVVAAVALARAP